MILSHRQEQARVRRALLAALASFGAAPLPAAETPTTPPDSGLQVRRAAVDSWHEALALDTTITVRVAGLVARAHVEQRFRNPADERVEARYVFPLPEGAAVDRLEIELGDRRIVGELREKRAARRVYDRARREGRKGALLESARPNVYAVSLAALDPDEEIVVRLEYQQLVDVDRGRFSLRVPLVVAPRYGSSRPPADPHSPTALLASVAAADHAVLPPGARPVHFELEVRPGAPLAELDSPSHALDVERSSPRAWHATLAAGEVPADRDVEVFWRLAGGAAPRLARFEEEVDGERFAALLFLPPERDAAVATLPRELVVVLDRSGSMAGESIAQAKRAVAAALARLAPFERFNVIAFSDQPQALFPASVEAGPRALAAAEQFVASIQAGGGTEMLPALALALDPPTDPTVVRQVLFVTDGQIADETSLFDLLSARLGESRLFTVGIGSAPNSYLLRRAAELGRGTQTFVGRLDEVASRMSELLAKLERPVLADVELEWDDPGAEAYPVRPRDLYAGEPLLTLVRLPRGDADVHVRGRLGEAPFEATLAPTAPLAASGLGRLWAERKIDALEAEMRLPGADPAALREEMVRLAVAHGIVTRFTSFVAVERTPSAPAGAPPPLRHVPSLMPAGQLSSELPQGGTSGRLQLVIALLLALTSAALLRPGLAS